MGQDSTIEWTTHTFNPWIGCTKVSDGCKFCYADALMDKRWGKVKWGPSGVRKRTSESNWRQPFKWNKAAKAAGERDRVFCASLADVGEDRPELIPWRAELCDVIRQCDWLWFLLLTKRPENMTRLFPADVLERCWLGTSVEDQKNADERIPHLLKCPAAVRFLSCEPLLGPVDLNNVRHTDGEHVTDALRGETVDLTTTCIDEEGTGIDWCIVGGESGAGARPCYVEWIRSIVRQCQAAHVPVFVKQLGAKPYGNVIQHPDGLMGVRLRIKDPKGGDIEEFPEDLRVRQMPVAAGKAVR